MASGATPRTRHSDRKKVARRSPAADSDLGALVELHLYVLVAWREDPPIRRTCASFRCSEGQAECFETVELEDRYEVRLGVTGRGGDRPPAHLVASQPGKPVRERKMD